MKNLTFLILLISLPVFSQELEYSPALKKYQSVEIVQYAGPKPTGWTTQFTLDDGVVVQQDVFHYNERRSGKKFTPEERAAAIQHRSDRPAVVEAHTALDSLTGYRREYQYDTAGNVACETIYSKPDHQFLVETNCYKYDDHQNIIEIHRDSNPRQAYPVMVNGGRALYEQEQFRYVYNPDGLWTAQYWTLQGKEILIAKRIFRQ